MSYLFHQIHTTVPGNTCQHVWRKVFEMVDIYVNFNACYLQYFFLFMYGVCITLYFLEERKIVRWLRQLPRARTMKRRKSKGNVNTVFKKIFIPQGSSFYRAFVFNISSLHMLILSFVWQCWWYIEHNLSKSWHWESVQHPDLKEQHRGERSTAVATPKEKFTYCYTQSDLLWGGRSGHRCSPKRISHR